MLFSFYTLMGVLMLGLAVFLKKQHLGTNELDCFGDTTFDVIGLMDVELRYRLTLRFVC